MTAILIIVAILVFVALYVFAVRENSKPQPPTTWKVPTQNTVTNPKK